MAFAHKRPAPALAGVSGSPAPCTSHFVEPVQWMEPALLGVMDGQVRTRLIFQLHGVACVLLLLAF